MRLTDRLSQPQKIVVVIALGVACVAAGIYLVSRGSTSTVTGWYAYAPLSQTAFPPRAGLAGWQRLIIWLALAGLWALVSIWVLRPFPKQPPNSGLSDGGLS
jgi:heme/copper-type cytochrome/quinol oxidase subunit 1